jgi:hypothetical protein
MSLYLEQFKRVKRFLKRIEDQDRDSNEYDDDLWSFFQNCWHLKDWVKNDDGVATDIQNNIESEALECLSIRICADLCNRSKHLKLTRSIREDAKISVRSVTIQAPPLSMNNEDNAKLKCVSSYEHIIKLQDGSRYSALEIARKSVEDWEILLKRHNLF